YGDWQRTGLSCSYLDPRFEVPGNPAWRRETVIGSHQPVVLGALDRLGRGPREQLLPRGHETGLERAFGDVQLGCCCRVAVPRGDQPQGFDLSRRQTLGRLGNVMEPAYQVRDLLDLIVVEVAVGARETRNRPGPDRAAGHGEAKDQPESLRFGEKAEGVGDIDLRP